jgi:alpha-tubulin suppressor-like RCC1 family protein
MSLGKAQTCAVVASGEVYCWGDGGASYPDTPLEGFSSIRQVAAGDTFVCALSGSGLVFCKGSRGDPSASDATQPIEGIANATRLASYGDAFCALLRDGTARCWRYRAKRAPAGGGADGLTRRPVRTLPLAGVVEVAVAETLTCALLRSGEVWCRLEGHVFSPANQTDDEDQPFVAIRGLGRTRAIAAGGQHACALSDEGTVGCFYHSGSGKLLGWPYGKDDRILRVLAIRDVVKIAAGGDHACALDAERHVGCWGLGSRGQVGTTRPLPYGMDWPRTALPVAWP